MKPILTAFATVACDPRPRGRHGRRHDLRARRPFPGPAPDLLTGSLKGMPCGAILEGCSSP